MWLLQESAFSLPNPEYLFTAAASPQQTTFRIQTNMEYEIILDSCLLHLYLNKVYTTVNKTKLNCIEQSYHKPYNYLAIRRRIGKNSGWKYCRDVMLPLLSSLAQLLELWGVLVLAAVSRPRSSDKNLKTDQFYMHGYSHTGYVS